MPENLIMIDAGLRFDAENEVWASTSVSRFAVFHSQGGLRPFGQQSSSHKVQIRQREHRKRSRCVLGQAAVTNRGESPQSLDHMKGVFRPSSAARACAIDHALICGQWMVMSLWPAVHPIADSGVLTVLPMIFAPVRLIPVQLIFATMEQPIQLGDVRLVGRSGDQAVYQVLLTGADVNLHAKGPFPLVLLAVAHFWITAVG